MSAHPEHTVHEEAAPGYWRPAKPLQDTGLVRWRSQRACHKAGGHWWHPADGMIGWYCCRCGKERDGMPEDGT